MVSRNSVKDILRVILKGYTIHENSYVEEASEGPIWDRASYSKTMEEAMTEAADGDSVIGNVAYLMSNNSNDLQYSAMELGIGYNKTGDVIDLPEKSCPEGHWAEWDSKEEKWVYKEIVSYDSDKEEIF